MKFRKGLYLMFSITGCHGPSTLATVLSGNPVDHQRDHRLGCPDQYVRLLPFAVAANSEALKQGCISSNAAPSAGRFNAGLN